MPGTGNGSPPPPGPLQFPGGLDAGAFLAGYWQRRPLLLRRALPGFASPLSAEELAGLACEEGVEARLVLERCGSRPWEVRHGPFAEEELAALPEDHWTLVVQDVDKHLPEVGRWREAFRFLPDWRADDIMVSYAADGGSVGPHLDEYDVFLIQAEGRRRWLIDPEPASAADFVPGLDLRILADFQARETHLLTPGDVLYLPPGVPHWGIAEGPCMTWSMGFRAPTWSELSVAWCEHAAEHGLPAGRYRDPGIRLQADAGEILPEVLATVRETLRRGLEQASGDAFGEWFGRFVTEPKEHLEVFPRPDPTSPTELRKRIAGARGLVRNGFSRMAFARVGAGDHMLFVNGEAHELPARHGEFLSLLTAETALPRESLAPWLTKPACLNLLCRLYNEGHYELQR
jgi:50S ribosomal protein L16 3-hydroxylase